jgi:hypothetical protein
MFHEGFSLFDSRPRHAQAMVSGEVSDADAATVSICDPLKQLDAAENRNSRYS